MEYEDAELTEAERAAIRLAIADLSDDAAKVRDEATGRLKSMGGKARRRLRIALKDAQDPEVRWRLDSILK